MGEDRGGALSKFGKALHTSQVTGNIIAKIDKPVEPGSGVVDEKLRRIGIVIEVFGPVASPYASIRPFNKADSTILDRKLYILKNSSHRAGRRKFR